MQYNNGCPGMSMQNMTTPGYRPNAIPGTMPQGTQGTMPGAMPQGIPGVSQYIMPGTMPGAMPQGIPGAGQQAMPVQQFVPQDMYSYPYNFPEALLLIRQAVSGEREDELFYEYLISEASSEEDKEIIKSIRDDERKHFIMFRQLYFQLTGQVLPPQQEAEFQKPKSYCKGLQKALFGELGAVERYRRILFALQDRRHINMMTEIITDELKHSSKYNFLYSKNECFRR